MTDLWNNDQVQFMRLLSEIRSIIEFTPDQYAVLGESMDLEQKDIDELLERAELAFQKHLGNVPKSMTIEQFHNA